MACSQGVMHFVESQTGIRSLLSAQPTCLHLLSSAQHNKQPFKQCPPCITEGDAEHGGAKPTNSPGRATLQWPCTQNMYISIYAGNKDTTIPD